MGEPCEHEFCLVSMEPDDAGTYTIRSKCKLCDEEWQYYECPLTGYLEGIPAGIGIKVAPVEFDMIDLKVE